MSSTTVRVLFGAIAGMFAGLGLDSIWLGLIALGAAQLLMGLGIVLFALWHDDLN
jgi:hypothetical protein